jgi:hypothetical protein
LTLDTVKNGFNNNGLRINYQNCNSSNINNDIGGSNLKISFQRNVSTYDKYDKKLISTFSFCIYLYAGGSVTVNQTDHYCDVV